MELSASVEPSQHREEFFTLDQKKLLVAHNRLLHLVEIDQIWEADARYCEYSYDILDFPEASDLLRDLNQRSIEAHEAPFVIQGTVSLSFEENREAF